MKLGELKSAIRTMKGNPSLHVNLPTVGNVWIAVQKASLLEGLDAGYGHKGVETGLRLKAGKIEIDLPEEIDILDLDAL